MNAFLVKLQDFACNFIKKVTDAYAFFNDIASI